MDINSMLMKLELFMNIKRNFHRLIEFGKMKIICMSRHIRVITMNGMKIMTGLMSMENVEN